MIRSVLQFTRYTWSLNVDEQRTLFFMCAGNEMFFVSLYLMKWVHTPISSFALLSSFTWPQILALVSLPVCFAKNVINLVQLWKASKILVGVDLAERAAAREKSQ